MCHALQVISKMHINFHIWQFFNLYPLYMGKNEVLRIRVYFLIFPQYTEIWGGGHNWSQSVEDSPDESCSVRSKPIH